MTSFARAPLPSPRRQIVLVGAPGSGRRTLAAALAAELGLPLLIADAGRLMGADADAAREVPVQVARSARLHGAAVYWHDADQVPAASWRDGAAGAGLTVFGAGAAGYAAPPGDDRSSQRTVRLPTLPRAARAALWARLSDAPAPPPVLDWPLRPADIARAAAAAPAGADAVIDACRPHLPVDSSALASRLARPYGWDDLVVTASVRGHLEEIEAQARLRWPVLEDWGFSRLCPMGRGISALFAGPSGTGKTMAAQVLARSLGMEIYRVDLAGVVSKYIGETEKNLRQVFDACERANVLLFFDEADALFGKRTQVKDAHDRFANIEIDYLLQRMEQFDGDRRPGHQPQERHRFRLPAPPAVRRRFPPPARGGAPPLVAARAAAHRAERRRTAGRDRLGHARAAAGDDRSRDQGRRARRRLPRPQRRDADPDVPPGPRRPAPVGQARLAGAPRRPRRVTAWTSMSIV